MKRRELIVALAATALALSTGCASMRSRSEIDGAFLELESLLSRLDPSELEALRTVVRKMQEDTAQLVETHEGFLRTFNEQALERTTEAQALNALVDDYLVSRREQWDSLLELQDQLKALLPEDAWSEVLGILNRKSRAVAAGSI